MTPMRAAGTRILALAFLSAVAGTGLAGCGSIDEALFGGGTEEAAQPPANAAPEAQAAPAPGTPVSSARACRDWGGGGRPVVNRCGAAGACRPVVSPVAIEGGANTGTAVGNTIQSLRSQLQNLDTKIAGDAQHAAELRNQDAQAVASYQQATAHISGRLGVGTTRGNPELIGEWNAAQATLDSLSANINALSALATEVSNDSSAAHNEGDTIQATFNVSGAVDEDHRQLSVLADETKSGHHPRRPADERSEARAAAADRLCGGRARQPLQARKRHQGRRLFFADAGQCALRRARAGGSGGEHAHGGRDGGGRTDCHHQVCARPCLL